MCCEDFEAKNYICVFFIPVCQSIAAFILIVFLSFKYVDYDFDKDNVISDISNNLNERLIYSIRLSKSCNSDEEKLILGTWDGIQEGCYCNKIILNEKCSETLIKQGCIIIPSSNPIDYLMINSNFICIKKSIFSYKDLLVNSEQIVEKNENCSSEYNKNCGKIDTLGKKLCVKKDKPCPIRDIDLKGINLKMFTEDLEIKSNYLEDDSEGQILSYFKLSEKLPCINPQERYWDYYYILEPKNQRCISRIFDKIYDDRYELLSNFTTNKYDLYFENSIIEKLKYISYQDLNKLRFDNVFLYGRNFLGFNKDNIKNNKFDYNYIISKQNLSNKIHNIMKYSLFVILGFYLLLLIVAASVFFGITSFGASGFSLVCEKNKNDADNELTYKVIFIIFIVLNILFLIVNYILSCIIVDCHNKIISNLNNKGNDIYIDALIDKILENHSSTYDFAKDRVIIMSFIPIAILVFLCLNYFCCLR